MSWLVIPSIKDPLLVNLASTIPLLRVLTTLKAEYKGAKNRSPIELLDWLLADPAKHKGTIGQVVSKISGRPLDDVMADWEELKKKYDAPQIQRLILLSRSFEQLKNDSLGLEKHITWKPLSKDISAISVPVPATTLNIGASASASFEFEALPATPDLPVDVNPSLKGESLVRMSFEGALGLSTDLGTKLPVSGGVLQGELGASGAGNLDAELYFLENGDTLFGIALAENLAALLAPNGSAMPFSATGLARLIEREGLYCLKFQAKGQLAFSGSLTLGQTFELGSQIKASIGASLGYRLTKTGTFDYLLAAHNVDGEPAIAIQIKRANARETLQSQSLGLELDPRALAKRLAPLVEDKLGKAEAALKEFSDFLPGSDFLSNTLEQLIQDQFKNQPALQGMLRSLVGIDPEKTPEEVLRDLIIGKIETSALAWSETVDQAVGSIVQDVTSALPPAANGASGLKEIIQAAVSAALEKRRVALSEKVEEKITNTNAYQTLAEKLNEAGASISKTVSTVQQGIDQATAGIRAQLNRVQEVISEMRGYLEAVTTKTVSLRIASEKLDKYDDTLNLRFDLFPHRDGAEEILSAILCGEMNQVSTLIDRQAGPPAVIARSGDFTAYQTHKQTSSTDLVLWNFQLGSQSILEHKIKWQIGVDGSITAMTQGSFEKINNSLKERDIVRFVDNADLFFSKNRRTVSIGITVSHEDESMSEKEVSDFFAGAVARKLLPQSVAVKAVASFKALSAKNTRKGRLDIGLTLSQQQLQRMFDGVAAMKDPVVCDELDSACRHLPCVQCQGAAPRQGCAWVLDTVADIQADVLQQHHSDQATIERLLKIAKDLGTPGDLASAIKLMTPGKAQTMWGEFALEDLSLLEYRRYGAMALYEILCRMKALAELPETLTLDATPKAIPGWTKETLNAQQQRISELMPVWWHWTGEWKHFLMLTDKMRASTLSLLESWITLAKGPDGEGTAPVLWASISLDTGNGKLNPALLT